MSVQIPGMNTAADRTVSGGLAVDTGEHPGGLTPFVAIRRCTKIHCGTVEFVTDDPMSGGEQR